MAFLLCEKYKIYFNSNYTYERIYKYSDNKYLYPMTIEKKKEIIIQWLKDSEHSELELYLSNKKYILKIYSYENNFNLYINITLRHIDYFDYINKKILEKYYINFFYKFGEKKFPVILILNSYYHLYGISEYYINSYYSNTFIYKPFNILELFARNSYYGENYYKKNNNSFYIIDCNYLLK